MIIKYIFFFVLVTTTIALPLESLDTSSENPEENEKNNLNPSIQIIPNPPEDIQPISTSDETSKNDETKDAPPDGDLSSNPSDEEKSSDLDTANTFGFGYGGWGGYRPYYGGYRPYYGYGGGYGGGWRGYGGFGGGFGFYGRSYHPWGWRSYYY